MKPLVSIVIPCYNAKRHIGEAINSALDQTIKETEVIVIDDGSTDGSLQVIRSFGDAVRWETGPNRGACAARNRGCELARGELIQFLDADDLLHAGKLERQIAVMNESGADLVFCHGQADDGADLPDGIYKRRYDGDDPIVFLLTGMLPTTAPLHRIENLRRIGGFREDLPCSQERDLHLRLACENLSFQQLPEVLFTVRRLPNSVSSNRIRVLDQHARVVWPVYETLSRRGQLTEGRARAFAGLLARDARVYLRLGQAGRAADYFRQARLMHSEGGLTSAYSGSTRFLRRLVGAGVVEKLVTVKRRVV